MITNAKPTGDDCPKCGNPNKMYWCDNCEESYEGNSYGVCFSCGGEVEVDKDYHLECEPECEHESTEMNHDGCFCLDCGEEL